MNYYEHHIGDYAEATGHLSFIEDAAYSRLIRKYYASESPLPSDPKAVERLVGASTRAERAAVRSVLEEFFSLQPDGWHNNRCDEEIGRYKAGEPERSARAQNENIRLRRHREERASLFGMINAAGFHLPYNAPIAEVRALVERIRGNDIKPETLPATAPATPATDLQRPPIHHSPDTRHQTPDTSTRTQSARAKPETPETPLEEGSLGSRDARHELMLELQAIYPRGIYADANWILAEREISKLLEAGEAPEKLLACTRAFRAQMDAKRSTGTQYVKSPEKFFGEGLWRGPFPLPIEQTSAPKRIRTATDIAEEYEARERANAS